MKWLAVARKRRLCVEKGAGAEVAGGRQRLEMGWCGEVREEPQAGRQEALPLTSPVPCPLSSSLGCS